MFTYLKNDINNTTISFEIQLPNDAYEIGSTYEDYINGKWILLNEKQISFYNENPSANSQEIIEMKMQPINIDIVKQAKINEITDYDTSSNVNCFFLNGKEVWLDRETRVSLMSTTQIKINLGEENTTIWLGNFNVTLPCKNVIQMLSQLEMYAYECFNQTAKHKAAVEALSNADEIKNYDITVGYPEKISFNV